MFGKISYSLALLLANDFSLYNLCNIFLEHFIIIIFICACMQEAANKVQPSLRREGFSSIPNVKWDDVGGLDLLRKEFERYIVRRIKYPEDYEVIFKY